MMRKEKEEKEEEEEESEKSYLLGLFLEVRDAREHSGFNLRLYILPFLHLLTVFCHVSLSLGILNFQFSLR